MLAQHVDRRNDGNVLGRRRMQIRLRLRCEPRKALIRHHARDAAAVGREARDERTILRQQGCVRVEQRTNRIDQKRRILEIKQRSKADQNAAKMSIGGADAGKLANEVECRVKENHFVPNEGTRIRPLMKTSASLTHEAKTPPLEFLHYPKASAFLH